MPIYDFECPIHGKQEVFLSLENYNVDVYCVNPHCDRKLKKIISSNIKRDEPTWIDSVNDTLNDGFMDRINTRSEMNKVLKEKGIVQVG